MDRVNAYDGIAQVHPAATGELAPLDAGSIHIVRHNIQRSTLRELIDNGAAARCFVNIQRADLPGGLGVADGCTVDSITRSLLPMGIEGLCLGGFIQLGHPGAAFLGCIPAHKAVTGAHRIGLGDNGLGCVVALNLHRTHTLIVLIHHIAVVRRRIHRVGSVEVHIGFRQTALYQVDIQLGAGVGPEGHGIDKIVALQAVDHGTTEFTVRIDPVSAHVVCKEHQGIKLVLLQTQAVALQEIMQCFFHIRQVFPQQRICLLFRNTIGIIILSAAAAIANGILAVVIVRLFHKALLLL